MKIRTAVFGILSALAPLCASAQGTFLYDQQSSSNDGYYGYGVGPTYQEMLPNTGQSFTPSLSGIDFIRLSIADGNQSDGLGSTWFLNLRSTAITGPILGTTATVYLPDLHVGATDFFFPNTLSLTPGTTYFFDVNSTDGGAWNIVIGQLPYAGGTAWGRNGSVTADYWFREGLVVPEPSSAALLLLGAGALACVRRAKGS